jgi:hypothetical protein
MTCNKFFWEHTRHCNWEDFNGCEEFLDEFGRKGGELVKRMVYEKKKEMRKNI